MIDIKVFVPGESSLITDMKGFPHPVSIDDQGRRYALLPIETVKTFLESGLECSLPWRELNPQLCNGALGPVEKIQPGINIARLQNAAWEATRPRTIMEDVAALRAELSRGWR